MKFTDPMPRNQPRGHSPVEWMGDRPKAIVNQRDAINRAHAKGSKRVPPPARDVNFHWWWFDLEDHSKGGEFYAVHYRRPGLVNFRFYLPSGATRARRMTARELTRARWTADQVARWRRGPNPDSARPATYRAMATLGRQQRIYVCAEIKSPEFATSPIPANEFVRDARQAGHPPWGMALLNMKGAKGKAAHLIAAGGQFALIFGRLARTARKPKDWPWPTPPTRIWNKSRRLQAWL